jgi:hypothetical protein
MKIVKLTNIIYVELFMEPYASKDSVGNPSLLYLQHQGLSTYTMTHLIDCTATNTHGSRQDMDIESSKQKCLLGHPPVLHPNSALCNGNGPNKISCLLLFPAHACTHHVNAYLGRAISADTQRNKGGLDWLRRYSGRVSMGCNKSYRFRPEKTTRGNFEDFVLFFWRMEILYGHVYGNGKGTVSR